MAVTFVVITKASPVRVLLLSMLQQDKEFAHPDANPGKSVPLLRLGYLPTRLWGVAWATDRAALEGREGAGTNSLPGVN